MAMVAEVVDAVVGGDTHRDQHSLVMVAPTGVTLASVTVGNDEAGFADALAWIAEHAPGPRLMLFVEGTRSYGIGLGRAAAAAGLRVVEVARVRRGDRRTGKSDAIDAGLVALQGLRMDADRLPSPRGDGDREGLRILLGARSDMSRTRTERVNRLRALLLSGSDADRVVARGGLGHAVLAGIVDRGDPAGASRDQQIRTGELRRLAAAIADADRQLAANKKQLAELVDELSPGLTARRGVGPVSAAQAIVSYSHYGRCRTEAAFAALAGVNPIPASSGLTVRHRLNRAGDRNLNQAIHTIVVTRWRDCPRTGRYIARRRAEGKTDREIRRCLKRYIARELYRNLNRAFKPATNHTVTAG